MSRNSKRTDEDFNEGAMVGAVAASDRLELSDEWGALPYIWVPNSGTGTVSKVDVETGDELGRYRTGPEAEIVPGVAAVDFDGACWVGNRGAGTVVKIGLNETVTVITFNNDDFTFVHHTKMISLTIERFDYSLIIVNCLKRINLPDTISFD